MKKNSDITWLSLALSMVSAYDIIHLRITNFEAFNDLNWISGFLITCIILLFFYYFLKRIIQPNFNNLFIQKIKSFYIQHKRTILIIFFFVSLIYISFRLCQIFNNNSNFTNEINLPEAASPEDVAKNDVELRKDSSGISGKSIKVPNESDNEQFKKTEEKELWTPPLRPERIKKGMIQYILLGTISNNKWKLTHFSSYHIGDDFDQKKILTELAAINEENRRFEMFDEMSTKSRSEYVSYPLNLRSASNIIDTIALRKGVYACWMKMEISN